MFKRRARAVKLQRLEDLEPLLEGDRPILIDFWQQGCQPCRTMDGIINELAEEYAESAHVVKVDLGRVPAAVHEYKIRSTPTFVVLARSQKGASKKKRRRQAPQIPGERPAMTARWRASGLVRKDVIARALESNGAERSAS
jgi:thioredoxin 1